jgi:hypothetical protein
VHDAEVEAGLAGVRRDVLRPVLRQHQVGVLEKEGASSDRRIYDYICCTSLYVR